jgi:hypothetical protein
MPRVVTVGEMPGGGNPWWETKVGGLVTLRYIKGLVLLIKCQSHTLIRDRIQ